MRKLSKKEIAKSVFCFLAGTAMLAAVLFLMLVLNESGEIFNYFTLNVNEVVTVGVSIAILSAITYCYFFYENKEILAKVSNIFEIFVLYCISVALYFVVAKYVGVVARPIAFLAMMLVMLYGRRDAIFLNTVFDILLLIVDRHLGQVTISESYACFLAGFTTGIVAIFLFKNIKTRLASVLAAFVLYIPTIAVNTAIILPSLEVIDWNAALNLLLFSALDCVFSVLLFFLILPVIETAFARLTAFRLRELTSDHAKLIKKLRTNALGTYNHSVVVAQLAEACAAAIGEDAELARAAAYYHDIGKLKNPEMFSENQSEYDLHKELTPELSVDIIRSHTRDGAKLIRKYHLPEFFAEVAVEHHGTLPVKYFYAKALRMSDGELNMGNYSYSGPTPTTKIAAIIMIVDASEAATRSLKDRSPEKVEALVKSLIEERMNLDQFADCDITMRELTIIARTVQNQLTGVYHSRVQYPKLELKKAKS